jgi:hypothetical protein
MLKQQKHLTNLKPKKFQSLPPPLHHMLPTPLIITNSLDQSYTCESNSLSGSQNIYCFLWNPKAHKVIKNGPSGRVNTQPNQRNIYYIDNIFRPLYWAIIRSMVFQRRLYSVVFTRTYVISTNEISLLTWTMIIVEKRKETKYYKRKIRIKIKESNHHTQKVKITKSKIKKS